MRKLSVAQRIQKLDKLASKLHLYSLADAFSEAEVQKLLPEYRGYSDSQLNLYLSTAYSPNAKEAARRVLDERKNPRSNQESNQDYGPQISVDREVAPLGQAFYADPTITEDIEGNVNMNFDPALIAGSPYPPVSTKLQRLLGVKQTGKLDKATKDAIFKAKREKGMPLSTSDKELERRLETDPLDPYADFD